MSSPLLFDFTVNKETNSIHIVREFAANVNLVWDAWTQPEIIDQWWAPKPYRSLTKSMDLQVGGTWLYAMISPKNEEFWCKAEYKKIEATHLLSWLDAFCDENGIENSDKPRSLWTNFFSEQNGITSVNITLQQDNLADVETLIAMGFKEGFTMGLNNLEDLLPTLSKK